MSLGKHRGPIPFRLVSSQAFATAISESLVKKFPNAHGKAQPYFTKVSTKLFYKSLFPHTSVNLFFISAIINDKMNFCGYLLLRNDFIRAFCEIKLPSLIDGLLAYNTPIASYTPCRFCLYFVWSTLPSGTCKRSRVWI